MRELLDNQVYVQIEHLYWGFCKLMWKPPNVCDKMEQEEKEKKKNTMGRLKIFLMKGGFYKALSEKWLDGSQ